MHQRSARVQARKVQATVLSATLLLLLLAPAAPSGAQDDESDWARIPELRVGDYWEYELGGRDRGFMMNEVVAEESKTNREFGVTARSFRIESTGVVYSKQASQGVGFSSAGQLPQDLEETKHEIDAVKWVRVDDHATVQMEGEVYIEETLDADVVESFDPPFVQTFFPFTDGYRWVSQTDFYLKRGGDDPKSDRAELRAHVTDMEPVQVTAGPFDTWRVKIEVKYYDDRLTSNVVQWWSQQACGLVKEERYDPDGELVNWMELTEWECSREHVQEPDYSGRGVHLTATANKQPPWLDEPLETGGPADDDTGGQITGSALPSGPVVWIALGVMAGLSVAFLVLGRRRG